MRGAIVALALFGCAHTPRGLGELASASRVLAHRGASAEAPENTRPAFDAAVALGVGFELDVGLSADGEVVVMHDETLDRTTDGTGVVESTPWADIEGLDAGRWRGAAFEGTPVPTLDQVLTQYAGQVVIDIELKTTTRRRELAEAVVQAVRRHRAVDGVLITSFDPYLLGEVAALEPGIRRGQITGTFEDADLTRLQKTVLRHVGLKRKAKPDFIAVEHVRATRRYIRRWQRRGYPVLAWTVNEPGRMRELFDLGIDGVITDHPDVALDVAAADGG